MPRKARKQMRGARPSKSKNRFPQPTRWTRALFGLIGVFLLSLSVPLGALFEKELKAIRQDFRELVPVVGLKEEISFEATLSKRVLSENETTTLNAYLTNKGFSVLDDKVLLTNSSFDSSPEDQQNVVVAPGEVKVITWILTPKKKGEFQISVTAHHETIFLGVVVTDILGLPTRTIYIIAGIAGAIVFIGGLIVIIRFILELREKRKQRKENTSSERRQRTFE